jgi:hypothetical protein
MLTLSVQQPFAHLILANIKRVENRTWATPYRGRIAVHATRLAVRSWSEIFDHDGPRVAIDEEFALEADGTVLPTLSALPVGAIVGTVEVYDCLEEMDLPDELLLHDPFVSGPWVWLLRNPQWLAQPIKCKGKLRLWEVPKGLRLP